MSNHQRIGDARARMNDAYRSLPHDYFEGKDGSTYRFNNIESVLDNLPVTKEGEDAVCETEIDAGALTLYVGVPWCERICSFCNFAYSTSSDEDRHSHYLAKLRDEMAAFFGENRPKVRSIYYGGGTPTYLSGKLLARHLQQASALVETDDKAGITCEFSTSTLTAEKLAVMRESGVTRLSVGVQSLDPEMRAQANLVGSGADALRSVDLAAAEYQNFNVDLIYGHPYQTLDDWIETVLEVARRDIPSITLYRLELKERTVFRKAFVSSSAELTDEENARLYYFVARGLLEEHGYIESPLGWWIKAKSLAADKQWVDYVNVWKTSNPYVGFGQGAFSVGSRHFWRNERSLKLWEHKAGTHRLTATSVRAVPRSAIVLNQLMRHVRMTRSIPLAMVANDLEARDLLPMVEEIVAQSVEWGLASELEDGVARLTEAGESLVHWMFADLTAKVAEALGGTPGNKHFAPAV